MPKTNKKKCPNCKKYALEIFPTFCMKCGGYESYGCENCGSEFIINEYDMSVGEEI